jgi:hypothetical protein
MTAAIDGEVFQVKVHGRLEGQECLNVLHFKTGVNNSSIEDDLLKALLDCFLDQLVPKLASTYSIERITAMRVIPTVGPEIEVSPDVGDVVAGASEGDALPSFVSGVISIRSVKAGRRGRGRMRIGGIPEIATTGSQIDAVSPLWTAIIAFIACVAGKFLGEGFPTVHKFRLGVISRADGSNKPPYAAGQFAEATNLVAKKLLGSCNSRKIGHGN